jgi:hypothetical protein
MFFNPTHVLKVGGKPDSSVLQNCDRESLYRTILLTIVLVYGLRRSL